MMLGTSHITSKYIDVNECNHDDYINSTIDIAFRIRKRIAKQKINIYFG